MSTRRIPKTKQPAPPPIDGFRRGHMSARFIAMALVIAPIVVWFVWRDPGQHITSAATTGKVVEYQKHIALLNLENGEQVRLYSGPKPVKAGDVLPLIADTYSNGTVQYRVDFKTIPGPEALKDKTTQ
jgi:hypothetical protein